MNQNNTAAEPGQTDVQPIPLLPKVRRRGRQPKQAAGIEIPVRSMNVTLDKATIDKAKRIGGNVSAGLRLAVARYNE